MEIGWEERMGFPCAIRELAGKSCWGQTEMPPGAGNGGAHGPQAPIHKFCIARGPAQQR